MTVGGRKGSAFFFLVFFLCGLAFSCYVMLLAQLDF